MATAALTGIILPGCANLCQVHRTSAASVAPLLIMAAVAERTGNTEWARNLRIAAAVSGTIAAITIHRCYPPVINQQVYIRRTQNNSWKMNKARQIAKKKPGIDYVAVKTTHPRPKPTEKPPKPAKKPPTPGKKIQPVVFYDVKKDRLKTDEVHELEVPPPSKKKTDTFVVGTPGLGGKTIEYANI
ncbi:MAG: hypothetical protein AAF514_05560 [Verrucomicrobiota bacterium]